MIFLNLSKYNRNSDKLNPVFSRKGARFSTKHETHKIRIPKGAKNNSAIQQKVVKIFQSSQTTIECLPKNKTEQPSDET